MCYLPSLLSHLRPYHKFLQQCLLVQGMQAGGLPGPRAVHERVLLIRKQISGIERGLHSIAKKRVSWYNGWQAAQVSTYSTTACPTRTFTYCQADDHIEWSGKGPCAVPCRAEVNAIRKAVRIAVM